MKDAHHLKSFGITLGDVQFDRAAVANHAAQLANRVKTNLEGSLKAQGGIGYIRTYKSKFQSWKIKSILTVIFLMDQI